jgi:O-methyltransferase
MPGRTRRALRKQFRRILSVLPQAKADYWMLDMAIKFVNHNTTTSRGRSAPGSPGSLLGDYLEFGCADGDSFLHTYRRAAPRMPWMRFWAFDSFAGLPAPAGIDRDGEAREGLFACDEHTFRRNLQAARVDWSRIECVPGWYHQTLVPELKRQRHLKLASIVYIDCDLYHSAVPALEFISDLVETGSVLIFDEWLTFKGDPQRGEQRACAEWLARHPQITLQDWHFFGAYGKSFIVVRREDAADRRQADA